MDTTNNNVNLFISTHEIDKNNFVKRYLALNCHIDVFGLRNLNHQE